ncbi:MAG: hypothetical protein ACM3RX_01930 [Methanococcaceae archaeon]
MGRMLLIVIMGLGILFTVINFSVKKSNVRMIESSATQYKRVQAKAIASSGVELATMKLSQDTNWTTGVLNLPMNGGFLSLSVASYPSKGLRVVTSKGFFKDAAGNVVIKDSAVATIQTKLPPAGGTPVFMSNALTSEGNISLNGNVEIKDDNNPLWNANVHTNGSFTMNGNNSIEGFLTTAGTASSNPPGSLNSKIVPNQNPDKLPLSHYQVPKITIPAFNASDYIAKAAIVNTGNEIRNGTTTLGTKDNPKIWYVAGDLNLSGNITGYGIFIVQGNINMNGNVNIISKDPNGNSLALYAHGDVNLSGNVNINAQLYSDRNVNFNGNVELHGLATARGLFNFGGNVDIFYRPSISALTTPIWNVTGSSSRKRSTIKPGTYYE